MIIVSNDCIKYFIYVASVLYTAPAPFKRVKNTIFCKYYIYNRESFHVYSNVVNILQGYINEGITNIETKMLTEATSNLIYKRKPYYYYLD